MSTALRPKVSIVVITYQHVNYIAQCLDGILMQRTAFPIEILVGDDGSTDGTRELCQRYAQEHPGKVKLYLRKQSDRNPAHPPGRDNLLALLNAAGGEYIARCDGDDHWTDPDKLQRQVDHLDAHPEHAGCFHWVQSVDEHSGEIGWVYGDHGDQLQFTVKDTMTVRAICHPSGFMYRRSALPVLPSWLGKVISADIAMYSLVAGSGDLSCDPVVMGVYRKHDGGVTASDDHQGSLYWKRRIILWLHVDKHYGYQYTARCQQLFRHHWRNILRQNTPAPRLSHLWDIFRAVPSWFLAQPAFAPGRLKEIITGKARRVNAAYIPLPYIAIVTPGRAHWDETLIAAHINSLRESELVISDTELRTKRGDPIPILTSTRGYKFRNLWEQKVLRWRMERMLEARIITLLRKRKIEVVLAEYGAAGEAILSICARLNLPLVVQFHDADAAFPEAKSGTEFQRLISVASALITSNRDMEQQLLALGASRANVFYRGNAVDLESEVQAHQEILEEVIQLHRKP